MHNVVKQAGQERIASLDSGLIQISEDELFIFRLFFDNFNWFSVCDVLPKM